MRILVVGLGVIGTTYGYIFQKSGHIVEHFIRESKRANASKKLTIDLLDGRRLPKGEKVSDSYTVSLSTLDTEYDFIIISVANGKLSEAIKTIEENNIKGTLLLFCNFWCTRQEVEDIVGGYPYIIGFPTAGGRMIDNKLDCVLFDNVKLESKEKAMINNYDTLIEVLTNAGIKTETPSDMIEWIWVHMAINAGVTSTVAKDGIVDNPTQLAKQLMNSSKMLSEATRTIRETIKIVEARGVCLKKYNNELLPYKMPSWLAGILMKRLFQGNELTRRIMLLHNDITDILYCCTCLYDTGRMLRIKTPLFSTKYEKIKEFL